MGLECDGGLPLPVRNGALQRATRKGDTELKVEETFVDTLAVAGAIVSAQLAGFMFLSSRQRGDNPALAWWAAALLAEAIRLGIIAISSAMPGAQTDFVGDGGHAVVALLMLVGCVQFTGNQQHIRTILISALLASGAFVLGIIFRPAIPLVHVALAVTATAAFGSMLWIFRSRQRTDGWYGYAAVTIPLLLTTAYLLGDTAHAIESFGATGAGLNSIEIYTWVGDWATIGDLGLSLFTLTSLLIVAQQRESWANRSATSRIEASEQRFRDIAEVAADWIWETGPDLRFNFFSDRLEQVTGLKPVDLLGKTRRDLLGGDPSEESWRNHLKDLDARRPFRNLEYALAAADGKLRHLRINGKPVYDANGKFLGYRGTGTDLTTQVEAQQQAARLDQRFHDAVESMPHGVALFDPEDRLIFCNSKHKFIYPNAWHLMVPGQTFEKILRAALDTDTFAIDESREAFIQRRLKAHRDQSREPLQQQQSDGRWVQISEMATTEGGTITSWTDITQLKRREQALAFLVEGNTNEGSFLDSAAKALAFGLGYRWAGISRFVDNGRAKLLAMWNTDGPGELFEYELADTPCASVASGQEFCFFPDRVADRFPQDAHLRKIGATSYRGQAIRDAGGRLIGHVFAINDCADSTETEQHELMSVVARWVGISIQQQRAEEALRDNETRFRDFAESASDWFWETDLDQRFTYYSANGPFDDIWETIDEEPNAPPYPIGHRRQDLWHGVAEPDHSATIAEYMADGEAFRDLQFRYRSPQRGDSYIRVSGKPAYDQHGQLVAYRGSGRDVTTEVTAELEHNKTARLLETVFENMAEGISVTDTELNVVAFNGRFLELLEFPTDYFHPGDPFERFIRYNAERGEYGDGDIDEQVRERVELAKKFTPHQIERVRPDGIVLEIRGIQMPGGGFVTTYADITERRQWEDALRKSEASLANAQRIARLGSWDWNIATNDLAWSAETYRIFGITPDEFDGTYDMFFHRVHPDDRDFVQLAVRRALTGTVYSIDHRVVLSDGNERVVHEQGEVEYDSDGTPLFLRGTAQDVTEQRRAESAIRESEQRIRAIMDNVVDSLVTIDQFGIIGSVNPATEALFGYDAAELIGRNVSLLMPASVGAQHDNFVQRYVATGISKVLGIFGREVTGQRKDGSTVDVELSITEMRHGGRRLFIGAMRDITERKQAEEALRQRTSFVELSKAVAAAANEAASIESALQVCLDEICHHTSWPIGHVYLLAEDRSGELVPSPIWTVAVPTQFVEFRRITMDTRLSRGQGTPGRVLESGLAQWISDIDKDDITNRVRITADMGIRAAFGFPITIGTEVVGVLEFFSDVPTELNPMALEVMTHVGTQIGRVIERTRAEKQLLAAKETAEYANRVKGEFLATMSHELRTPLNAIIGFSEVMMQELFGPMGHANYKDYAGDILHSGRHLLELINDILDVSKAEAGMIDLAEEVVDMADVIEACLRLIRPRATEKDLTVETDLPQQNVQIRADRRRLKQVLLNLLSNAIKFTENGGVTVKLRCNPNDGMILRVVDTGIGISQVDLDRVMEPFVQADSTLSRSAEGTGLGLPLSRALVELHGGELTITSELGKGAVTTVRLPAERLLGSADAA